MGKSIHVVILAGGYSPAVGGGAPGLARLGSTPAVVRLLRALQSVRRVTLESVWVVHNASDEAELKGPGGVFAEEPPSDVGLPSVNFLSNGASSAAAWQGEAADLRAALAALAKGGALGGGGGGSAGGVAVLSASVAFMPNYNLQRLLEHSYLRGRDVLGASFLSGLDVALLGQQGHTAVVAAEDGPLPRIGQLAAGSEGAPGLLVAEPYLFLQPSSAAALASSPPGGAGRSLIDVAATRVSVGGYVAAIDLMFGRYNLRTPEAVKYTDGFFAFCAAAAIDPASVGLRASSVLQPYDTTPGGAARPADVPPPQPAAGTVRGVRTATAAFQFDQLDGTKQAAEAASLVSSDYAAFLSMASAFNDRFFGTETGSAGGATGRFGGAGGPGTIPGSGPTKSYMLPPTFYMTAYRRQAADAMV